MNSGFKSQCVPQYRILKEAQIKRIHCATLELLETVGVKVMDGEARKMLDDAGCRLRDDNIVQIPNWLVEDCIRSAPSRITIYNRLGKEAMRLEGHRIHYGMGTDLINTIDLDTGELRQSRLQDDRPGMNPHAPRPMAGKTPLCGQRQRFDAIGIGGPPRHVHLGRGDRRRHAAV